MLVAVALPRPLHEEPQLRLRLLPPLLLDQQHRELPQLGDAVGVRRAERRLREVEQLAEVALAVRRFFGRRRVRLDWPNQLELLLQRHGLDVALEYSVHSLRQLPKGVVERALVLLRN